MLPSMVITEYSLSQNRSIFAGEMYSTKYVEWTADYSGLGLT